MAAPTAPTLVSLSTEALKKAGHSAPGATLLAQAQDQWMEEIKNDIWTLGKRLSSLQTTKIMITVNGQSRYAYPSDYTSEMTMQILDGTLIGTAQTGTSGSITLSAATSISSNDIIGKEILIYSGTGIGSISQCTAYDSDTKIASVTPDFATTPDNTSKYMIIDTYYPMIQNPIWDIDRTNYPTLRDRPTHWFPIGSGVYGEFNIFPVPYRESAIPWGLKLRYYANLMTLDLTGTLMAKLYQDWRNEFIQGVKAKCIEQDDDERARDELAKYINMLHLLVTRETYGTDLSNLRMTVSHY